MSDTFNAKFRAVLSELQNPVKDNTATVPTRSGKTYSYSYEDLASILNLIRPVLSSHGMGQYQESYWVSESRGYVLRTTVFDDAEERLMDERPLKFDGVDAQTAGSYETYMRRYALKTVFGLAGDDDDGASTTPQTAPQRSNSPVSAPKPQTPEIKDEEHSEPYIQERDALWHRINELKAEALSLGIIEDAMKSKITIMLGGKKFTEANITELLGIAEYIEGLITDKKELNGVYKQGDDKQEPDSAAAVEDIPDGTGISQLFDSGE